MNSARLFQVVIVALAFCATTPAYSATPAYATTIFALDDLKDVTVTTPQQCDDVLHISSVDVDELVKALAHIKRCVKPDIKLNVLISGVGGSVIDAQAFFDHMRTSGLSGHVRFIAFGVIASASNLVWLSAAERVVMPGTQFLLHELKTTNVSEDPELALSMKLIHVRATTRSVRVSAGDQAAKLWEQCFNDKQVGTAFDGKEAVENGWATELWNYKK